MKLPIMLLLGTATAPLFADGLAEGNGLSSRVREATLDQLRPVEVLASTHGVTTLQFPEKVEALDGDGFTQKPGEEAGEFSITPGANWVSVRSLRAGAVQNLNVVIAGKVYPVLLRTAESNEFSVLFRFAGGSGPLTAGQAAKGATPNKGISAPRILGLIDKMKGYRVFSEQAPGMYIDCDISEPKAPKGADETDRVKSQIVRIVRDNHLDAVAFEVRLQNKLDGEIVYDPNGLAVRVGKEIYPAIMGDGFGKIEPKGQQTAFFVVAGSANSGVPNNLSAYNEFKLVVR
jgi:hypothetical protein